MSLIITPSGGAKTQLIYQSPNIADVKIATTLDNDHLWCDGQAVSRTTYADLFGVIGTTYGVGDNSTTFNLPDFNDGGLTHKYAICFRDLRETISSEYVMPFLDVDSLATVKSYYGSTPPTGWVWTQGQSISRITYSDLFSIIGTTYGVGDGSTTFNLPDIGTNYIIKITNALNAESYTEPIERSIGNAYYTSIDLVQLAAGTSQVTSFSASAYSSTEMLLQIKQNSNFEIVKLLVISNGTDTYLEEYGRAGSATNVVLSATISSGSVVINATSTTTPATIKGVMTNIKI